MVMYNIDFMNILSGETTRRDEFIRKSVMTFKKILTVLIQRIGGPGAEGETDDMVSSLRQSVGKAVRLTGDAVGPVGRQFFAEKCDPDKIRLSR